jgi:23S rRNA pseudouridine955/2504/2580 synthase
MFTPSPVNRLDRNTTGLVVFGKNAKAVRDFNRMIAAEDAVRKYYLALALGGIPEEVTFEGSILKDEGKNRVSVTEGPSAKESRTIARPVRTLHDGGSIYTLACVRLVTGRPHQIRAHLAEAGHPVVGDPKYGDRNANRRFAERHGLVSQFLHACRLEITEGRGSLEYLTGRVIESPLPRRLAGVLESLEQRD